MLSNEQRAHDIAIAILTGILNNPSNYVETESLKDGSATIDVMEKYLSAYKLVLDSLNAHFPTNE